MDLGLELLDAGALDTGKYRAVVVRDPEDPQRLRGFVHLAAVGIRSAEQAAERSTRYLEQASYLDNGSLLAIDWRPRANVRALAELAGELGARTQLTATVDGDEHLEDTGWMDTPFVLLTAAAEFEPTSVEVEHLGQYLAKGGFAYVEVVGHASREAERYGWLRDLTSLRSLVEKALTSQGLHPGRDWTLRRLDLSHPLFTSYQAIGSLPRPYWSTMQAVYSNGYREPLDYPGRFGWSSREQPYLEGIFVRGRLAGIYSKQNYRDLWARRIEAGLRSPDPLLVAWYGQNLGNRSSGDAALRVGINIVVYALTQEGSLARQYVATRAVGGAPR